MPTVLQPHVHIVIIGWQGRGGAARAIAPAVAPVAEGPSVIYFNAGDHLEAGPGDGVQLPNRCGT